MKYNFDKIVNRRNTYSCKWDIGENELPMWIADMDFQTVPEVIEDLKQRATHGVFGYSIVPDEWYDAYSNWWKTMHNYEIKNEWLMFTTGVVSAISSIVRKITTPAEKVLIQTPVYNVFFNSILNNGREVITNDLVYDGTNYHIDFDDLEKELSDPQTTLMILCNPHNPIGKIWSKEELARIGELCAKYNVIVLSDEIHCDITDPDKEYIPFGSVNETCQNNAIFCFSVSKAFNLAGLQSAAVCVPNPILRHKVWRGINTDEVAEPNDFAIYGAISALNNGKEWLGELKEYLYENKKIVNEFVKNQIPILKIVPSNATYLLWIDCHNLEGTSKEIADFIRSKTGLYLSSGHIYGENGKHFLRMNIACPKTLLMDGLNRLKKAIELYVK